MSDKAHLEPATEPIFQRRDGVRGTIASQDDLPTVALDGVERVEELLLETFLSFHELDVVH